jgi:hypothetical protein
MDLLLHVGLHKTGTSAAQQLLYSKSADLKDHGILYPDSGIYGIHHALIPGCLIPEHPFLDRVQRSRNLDDYIDSLQAEVSQCNPALTIISSEVFGEILTDGNACLRLIAKLSLSFANTNILLTRRDLKTMSLSSLKHMQRELFAQLPTGFDRAFVDPIAIFSESISRFESMERFWHESGLTVHEKHLEAASGSLADHYFGDFIDHYCPKARALLGADSIDDMDPRLDLNIDVLPSLAYMLFFLLGNSKSSNSLVNRPVLEIILEECNLSANCFGLDTSIKTAHLLAYLDFFMTGSALANNGEILVTQAQKANALKHAGLSSLEIKGLYTLLNSVYLRLTKC